VAGNRDGDDKAEEAKLDRQGGDVMQKGPKPNELVGFMQERAGSVGAVKRSGGTDEGGGVG
jgi:hypothetical protein